MLMAVQKCAKDPSPYVRRCSANAIPKLHALDREQYHDTLEELIGVLLDDKSARVVGAAAAAFVVVCPEQFGLVASRYRKLCEALPEVEEWGQVLLVDILLRYVVARYGLPQLREGSVDKSLSVKGKLEKDNQEAMKINHGERVSFSMAGKVHPSTTEVKNNMSTSARAEGYQSDVSEDEIQKCQVSDNVRLLLQCTLALLWSHNSAVVMAAAGVHWLLAPKGETHKIVKPLLFLMRSSYDSQYVVITNLLTFVQERPYLFETFYEDFYIRSSDTQHIRAMKLDILALIATEVSITPILQELQAYVRDPDRQFAADAVNAIGSCARRHPFIALTCMEGLLLLARGNNSSVHDGDASKFKQNGMMKVASKKKLTEKQLSGDSQSCDNINRNREAVVVTQAVLAMRSIVQQHFQDVEKIFAQLVRDLDIIKVPAARAVVIWMIGEYGCDSALIQKMLPTIFKYLGACFVKEEVGSKLQILNCICKVVFHSQVAFDSSFRTVVLALTYLLDLGGCDVNYDVRDRARMLKQLMAVHLKAFPCASGSLALENVTGSAKSPVDSGAEILQKHQQSSKGSDNILMQLPGYILISSKLTSPFPFVSCERTFLPGSMSHIVRHNAPGYKPLPEPCSMEEPSPTLGIPRMVEDFPSNSLGLNLSESHEVGEDCDSIGSYSTGSSDSGSGEDSDSKGDCVKEANGIAHSDASEHESSISTPEDYERHEQGSRGTHNEAEVRPLICFSDSEPGGVDENPRSAREPLDAEQSASGWLQSRTSQNLESWLGSSSLETVEGTECLPQELTTSTGLATLSLGSIDTEPKKVTLLDFTNGEGLEVKYCYCFSASNYSCDMVWIRLFMCNRSSDMLSTISVRGWESEGTIMGLLSAKEEGSIKPCAGKGEETALVIPSQEIPTLDPYSVTEADLHINFHQQFMPVKLAVYCNEKCFPVKLLPDMGALLRPKVLNLEGFTSGESRLIGMFESTRRCFVKGHLDDISDKNLVAPEVDEKILFLARDVASKVLQNVNVSLVSATVPIFPRVSGDDAWSLRLRFSGETLMTSMLCLITVMVEASNTDSSSKIPVLVKVNCEDSIFGLNLLNRLDRAINGMD